MGERDIIKGECGVVPLNKKNHPKEQIAKESSINTTWSKTRAEIIRKSIKWYDLRYLAK